MPVTLLRLKSQNVRKIHQKKLAIGLKEYAKVLQDDERLIKMLREGVDENALTKGEINDILALRDLLVNRFGAGKQAG